jgi:hypothetical protein
VVEYGLQTHEEAVTDRLLFHWGEFAHIESMLQEGGFLLSNNALLELPVSKMKSIDYLTVVYSDRPGDGDHIVWYQRAPARRRIATEPQRHREVKGITEKYLHLSVSLWLRGIFTPT